MIVAYNKPTVESEKTSSKHFDSVSDSNAKTTGEPGSEDSVRTELDGEIE